MSETHGDRNLGLQPIAAILEAENLTAHQLVEASTELITHKMVSRACKGRRLTANVQRKILRALKKASGKEFTMDDLFTYKGTGSSGKV